MRNNKNQNLISDKEISEYSSSEEPSLKTAHVLFMDVVGYSKLKSNQEVEVIETLNQIVKECMPNEKRLILPTGDGMAIAFLENPASPLLTARMIAPKVKMAEISLRMGMHSGPVYLNKDINQKKNIVGDGINLAQRVMDCGNSGHILASKVVAEALSEVKEEYERLFHYLGKYDVKHKVVIEIYNVYNADFGNNNRPIPKTHPDTRRRKRNPKIKLPYAPLLQIKRINLYIGENIDPFDKALIDLLSSLTETWSSIDSNLISNTHEKAIMRLVQSGLIEERIIVEASVDEFNENITLLCRVQGKYKDFLHDKISRYLPHWMDEQGRALGHFDMNICKNFQARLTTEGERAKQELHNSNIDLVLVFLRGGITCGKGSSSSGIVSIEKTARNITHKNM